MKIEFGSKWRRRGSRPLLLSGSAIAIVLVVASIAWACTLQVGTILICSPPSPVFVSGNCVEKSSSGSQTGSVSVSKDGSSISVTGTDFYLEPYSVIFQAPGATSNCHSAGGAGNTSLLGTTPDGKPVTVLGPDFVATGVTPAVSSTGDGKICVQDEPDRVTGGAVLIAVI